MALHAPRIVPGARVSTFARHFGQEWAEAHFDRRWATARCKGVVQTAVGLGKWLVLWDGDEEPLESTRAHLRLERAASDDEMQEGDGGDTDPYDYEELPSSEEEFVPEYPPAGQPPLPLSDSDDMDEDEDDEDVDCHGQSWGKISDVRVRPSAAKRYVGAWGGRRDTQPGPVAIAQSE